jgi:hypothetical protein
MQRHFLLRESIALVKLQLPATMVLIGVICSLHPAWILSGRDGTGVKVPLHSISYLLTVLTAWQACPGGKTRQAFPLM